MQSQKADDWAHWTSFVSWHLIESLSILSFVLNIDLFTVLKGLCGCQDQTEELISEKSISFSSEYLLWLKGQTKFSQTAENIN